MEKEKVGKKVKVKKNNTTKMTHAIEEGSRYGISEEGMAAMTNAVHKDDGIDLSQHPEIVVGKSKVNSQKVKHLTELAEKPAEPTSALYLDGKKFETLHQEKLADDQYHQRKSKDEHWGVFTLKSIIAISNCYFVTAIIE